MPSFDNRVTRLTRQVCGRIDAVRPVAEILAEICSECFATVDDPARSNPPPIR